MVHKAIPFILCISQLLGAMVLAARSWENKGLESIQKNKNGRRGRVAHRHVSCKYAFYKDLLFLHTRAQVCTAIPCHAQPNMKSLQKPLPESPREGVMQSSEKPASYRCVLSPCFTYGKDKPMSGAGCGSQHWTLTGRMPSAYRWLPGHLHFPAASG